MLNQPLSQSSTTLIPPLTQHSALIVVDIQPDFMPGGPLPCQQGDAFLPTLDALLQARRFPHVVATQDWHPAGHGSFASTHPDRARFETIERYGQPQTLWPDHCLAGSPGAALHPAVNWSAADLILRKGCQREVDSYSAFQENFGPNGQRAPTGLAGWLHERGVREVWVCGLAREVCVLWTAVDACAAGFSAHLLWELSRPVSPAGDEAARIACARAGVNIVEATEHELRHKLNLGIEQLSF